VDPNEEQTTQLHNGATGTAPKITYVSDFTYFDSDDVYYEGSLKDMVVVLPGDPDAFTGRGSIIRTIPFPKVGQYSFHCHILSHEVRINICKMHGRSISICFNTLCFILFHFIVFCCTLQDHEMMRVFFVESDDFKEPPPGDSHHGDGGSHENDDDVDDDDDYSNVPDSHDPSSSLDHIFEAPCGCNCDCDPGPCACRCDCDGMHVKKTITYYSDH
jgi:hypothetical protein